ncbi:MAG: hypothetical protein ABIR66_10875 [Saprospiraceae bacterium]
MLFDLSFLDEKIPVELTVYFQEDISMILPRVIIQPEKFYHRIGVYLGMQDIRNFLIFIQLQHEGEPFDDVHKFFTDQVKGFFSYEESWIIDI